MSVIAVGNYVAGRWIIPSGGQEVPDAIYGEPVATVSSEGVPVEALFEHARTVGGPALRRLTFHERARRLRALASYLLERKERYYTLSMLTGATCRDCMVDVDGGIGTLFSYSSLARRELPDETFLLEPVERLSRNGTFVGRHILTSRQGAALHINAFNFPVWGMLEKAAPGLIAGVPQIVKPATPTAFVTEAVVRDILESGLLPEGALQLIVGTPPDLLEHLTEQDLVTFTGSASTARKLRVHPQVLRHSVPFTTEADSLNCIVLGQTVQPDHPEFGLFVREIVNEMTIKAGQRCTAIRRVIVPRDHTEAVLEALRERLERVTIGDPRDEAVKMGPLVGAAQRDGVREVVQTLRQGCEQVYGSADLELHGGDLERGGFLSPTVLYCDRPGDTDGPHDLEPFGPVVTVMPYHGLEQAIALARRGKGSLVGSVVTQDRHEARELFFGLSSHHGRLHILNRESAPESTGHGSPLPSLVHGGPGRAGGGEELGGLRAVRHSMVRTAVQADPTTLAFLSSEHVRGAAVLEDRVHPFRRYYQELEVGQSLLTHRRTVTEADLVNFAAVSGDHFYAHTDEIGARESLFGKRVAHGYFVVSAAAGLFVDPGVGPVLANYGLENLRFVEPVGVGDTIQARLTVKRKIPREQKTPEERPAGVVEWDVEITNQHGVSVALYSILTLVAKLPEERSPSSSPESGVERPQA